MRIIPICVRVEMQQSPGEGQFSIDYAAIICVRRAFDIFIWESSAVGDAPACVFRRGAHQRSSPMLEEVESKEAN